MENDFEKGILKDIPTHRIRQLLSQFFNKAKVTLFPSTRYNSSIPLLAVNREAARPNGYGIVFQVKKITSHFNATYFDYIQS